MSDCRKGKKIFSPGKILENTINFNSHITAFHMKVPVFYVHEVFRAS